MTSKIHSRSSRSLLDLSSSPVCGEQAEFNTSSYIEWNSAAAASLSGRASHVNGWPHPPTDGNYATQLTGDIVELLGRKCYTSCILFNNRDSVASPESRVSTVLFSNVPNCLLYFRDDFACLPGF